MAAGGRGRPDSRRGRRLRRQSRVRAERGAEVLVTREAGEKALHGQRARQFPSLVAQARWERIIISRVEITFLRPRQAGKQSNMPLARAKQKETFTHFELTSRSPRPAWASARPSTRQRAPLPPSSPISSAFLSRGVDFWWTFGGLLVDFWWTFGHSPRVLRAAIKGNSNKKRRRLDGYLESCECVCAPRPDQIPLFFPPAPPHHDEQRRLHFRPPPRGGSQWLFKRQMLPQILSRVRSYWPSWIPRETGSC